MSLIDTIIKLSEDIDSIISSELKSYYDSRDDFSKIKELIKSNDVIARNNLIEFILKIKKRYDSFPKIIKELLEGLNLKINEEITMLQGTTAQKHFLEFRNNYILPCNKYINSFETISQSYRELEKNIMQEKKDDDLNQLFIQTEKLRESSYDLLRRFEKYFLSNFLKNYQSILKQSEKYKPNGLTIEQHIDDLIKGKKKYFFGYTIKKRVDILKKYLKMQDILNPDLQEKIYTFIYLEMNEKSFQETMSSKEMDEKIEKTRKKLIKLFPLDKLFTNEDTAEIRKVKSFKYELFLDYFSYAEAIRQVFSNYFEHNTVVNEYWPRILDKDANIHEDLGPICYGVAESSFLHKFKENITGYPYHGLFGFSGPLGRNNQSNISELQPQVVAVAIANAVMPAIILKSYMKEMVNIKLLQKMPYFFMPTSKSYKLGFNMNQVHSDIGSFKSDEEFKEFILEKYALGTLEKTKDHIRAYMKDVERAKAIIKKFIKNNEFRLLCFDEHIYQGKNTRGLKLLFEIAFEMLKYDKKISTSAEYIVNRVDAGMEPFKNSKLLKGFITPDKNFGLKGGSDFEHLLFSKLFAKYGEVSAKFNNVEKLV